MTATPEKSEKITSMKTDLAPLSFAEAKAYLLGKIPQCDSMGLMGSPGLGEGLALLAGSYREGENPGVLQRASRGSGRCSSSIHQ